MKRTLLEEARKVRVTHGRVSTATQEEIDLAVAWARDEITVTQVATVKKYAKADKKADCQRSYIFLLRCLKAYVAGLPRHQAPGSKDRP